MTEFGRHVSIIFAGLLGGSLGMEVAFILVPLGYTAGNFRRVTTAGPWPVKGGRGAEC